MERRGSHARREKLAWWGLTGAGVPIAFRRYVICRVGSSSSGCALAATADRLINRATITIRDNSQRKRHEILGFHARLAACRRTCVRRQRDRAGRHFARRLSRQQSGAGGAGPRHRRHPRRLGRSRPRARPPRQPAGRAQAAGQCSGGDRGGERRPGRYRLHRLRALARRHGRLLADLHAGAAKLPGARQFADPRDRRRRPRGTEDRRHPRRIRSHFS